MLVFRPCASVLVGLRLCGKFVGSHIEGDGGADSSEPEARHPVRPGEGADKEISLLGVPGAWVRAWLSEGTEGGGVARQDRPRRHAARDYAPARRMWSSFPSR